MRTHIGERAGRMRALIVLLNEQNLLAKVIVSLGQTSELIELEFPNSCRKPLVDSFLWTLIE